MSTAIEAEKLGGLEFKWGKKRGVGGKNKDVRFYEDFSYDGMDYALYDSVFMHKEGEPVPYIGKLVKIWENKDKSKKIKVQWFFRPSEISVHLKDAELLENELFFASGDGRGLANINPLEAIAGKCNVVCISKDSRNPQPSAEELEAADYVFYRVFDVKSCTVSDRMDDTVGGIEVKYVFNRGESVRTPAVPNHNPSGREIPGVAANGANYVKQGENAKGTRVKKGNLPGDGPSPSGVHVNSSDIRKLNDISIEKRSMLGEKNIGGKAGNEKDKSKDIKSSTGQVKVEERVKDARNPGDLDGTQPKKARLDGTVSSLEVKDVGCVRSLTSPGKDAVNLVTGVPSANTNSQSELNKNLDRSEKDGNLAGKSGDLNEKLLKSAELTKDSEGVGKDAKLKKDVNASHGKPSKESTATEMGKELVENLSARKRLLNIDVASELVNNPNSTQIPLKRTPKGGNTPYDNDIRMANDSSPLGGPPKKKGNFDANAKNFVDCKNKNNENMKDKASPSEVKNLPKLEDHNDMAKSKLIKGGPKENTNVEVGKPPRNNLSTPTTRNGGDGKVESHTFEVIRRPIIEKSNWMKLNWEDKMKNAHDQGRLLLLQNLDLTYTSGDVEDLVWHAFKEECTSKMVQHTAISNPYSGQALVILKTREAVDRILKKLDNGCLMLPNKRPLVARTVNFPKFLEKQTTFVGHLSFDKARRQIQREMKEAVATSHYSQNNTIEYEMAMSWCFLQLKSDKWWTALYKQQRMEVEKLTGYLKSK